MLNLKQIIEASKGKYINGNMNKMICGYSIDSRLIKEDEFFIPIVGEKTDAHKYILTLIEKKISGFFIQSSNKEKEDIIQKSININKDICIVEIENSEKALYQIGMHNRKLHMNIPVVAVTGSVGKTSTKEMIASILETQLNVIKTYKNFNGYIGLSLMLLKLENQDVAVLEHGIDRINEMNELSLASKPDISVVTMIGTSHIGIFGSRDVIFNEKLNITNYMKDNAILILNEDDKYLKSYKNERLKINEYSINDVNNINIVENSTEFNTKIYNENVNVIIDEIGKHNIYNSLAGIKVAEKFNISKDNILKGIKNYKNFERRFQKILLKDNIQIIDDTYNASIDSMKSGIIASGNISSFRKIIVLGDMLELGNYSKELHEDVGKIFKEEKVDILYTFGKESKYIANEAKKYITNVKYFSDSDKEELIKDLIENICPNDLIYFKASNGMKFNEIIEIIKTKYL
ncbi:MAG: UDP-N-acetylmuramoyl-tripeptide--D-alanyl-D-alanine ligase [Clostridia bacterium]